MTTFTTATDYLENKKCAVGVLATVSPVDGTYTKHFMRCKKRLCPNCQEFWAKRHVRRLQEREKLLGLTNTTESLYHVVLTTACSITPEQAYNAFRYFWRFMREELGKLHYFCTVEQNRQATLVHFHILIAFCGEKNYVKYDLVRELWVKAQDWAHISRPANIIHVKHLKDKNAGFYLLKYLRKEGDKSYEIPSKKVWAGRHVRTSRNFYPVKTVLLDATFGYFTALQEPQNNAYIAVELQPNVDEINKPVFNALKIFNECSEVVKREWNYRDDLSRVTHIIDSSTGELYNFVDDSDIQLPLLDLTTVA